MKRLWLVLTVAMIMVLPTPVTAETRVRTGWQSATLVLAGPGMSAIPDCERITFSQRVVERSPGRTVVAVRSGGAFYSTAPYPPSRPVPSSVARYLASTPGVQSEDRRLKQLAGDLAQGHTLQRDVTTAIIHWVIDHLTYDSSVVPDDALSAYLSRRARCSGYSSLSVALLRAAGIPARIATGWSQDENDGRGGLHDWIELWYPDTGWVMCEPQSELHSVGARYLWFASRADGKDWTDEMRALAQAFRSGTVTVLDYQDHTRLIDILDRPERWVLATGDERSVSGRTLSVRISGELPSVLGGSVELSLGTSGRIVLRLGSGAWRLDGSSALAEVYGDGLSIAGLPSGPITALFNLPLGPMPMIFSAGVPTGYSSLHLDRDRPATMPTAFRARTTVTVPVLEVTATGPGAVGVPAGTELRVIRATGGAYRFGASDLVPGRRWSLTGMPADIPGQSASLLVTEHGLVLAGWAPGDYRLLWSVPGQTEWSTTIRVSEGWKVEPLAWSGSGLLGPVSALRYWERWRRLSSDMVTIEVQGQAITVERPPLVVGGRTMLPLRAVAEALGAVVFWDGALGQATVERDGRRAIVDAPGGRIVVDGRVVSEATMFNHGGFLFVPIRGLADGLGLSVSYDEGWRTVLVSVP